MVVIYYRTESGVETVQLTQNNHQLLENAFWIDILSPTKEEETFLESHLKLQIPNKLEVEEIEPSSRLYIENNNLFMSATMVAMSDQPEVKTEVVTFILTKNTLVTLRYVEFYAFILFRAELLQSKKNDYSPSLILIELLDTVTERLADILEKISRQSDDLSKQIFHHSNNVHAGKHKSFTDILQFIGTNGDLETKARESLVALIRLISFLVEVPDFEFSKKTRFLLIMVNKDLHALKDYADFLSNKINFLLDATLGMINIEQNNIIKIFSVAAVIFLPPTLIASIYGMNFSHMPELSWHVGYPIAIVLMLISAWLPFRYFKKKKWL